MPRFDSLSEDSNTLYPTEFDISRLKDMEIGDKILSESGNWHCMKYKNEYVLLLNGKKYKKNMLEFKYLSELIIFLKKN
ncbi:MAG: hypothetical protein Q7R95_10565 [bacterium]|nr:hypothetical protein [bacterium]